MLWTKSLPFQITYVNRDVQKSCASISSPESLKVVALGAAWSGYNEDWMSGERNGTIANLNTPNENEIFFFNLEDYVRSLQAADAEVFLILGHPVDKRFDPDQMVRFHSRRISIFDSRAEVEPNSVKC
ncbi:AIM29 family protein [Bradyrhizobium sp. 41S5]|uniref:hypothetical protein n=1 Tax=Bradyrhizobium sp. 41S5 TaxID=1404443 RepID=UPI00156AB1AB|nr:hypothetical protein [Bradyrhizobium sp. 41S5]UFX42732.1 AIM29 family protein [Bradyrhizobium sp. 41S5]